MKMKLQKKGSTPHLISSGRRTGFYINYDIRYRMGDELNENK